MKKNMKKSMKFNKISQSNLMAKILNLTSKNNHLLSFTMPRNKKIKEVKRI